MKNYYEILGVKREAGTEEIKRAYRRLVKKFHPDSGRTSAEAKERFQEISEAYRVLSNEESRKQYDMWGHAAYQKHGGHRSWETWEENGHCGACQRKQEDRQEEPPPRSVRVAVKMSYQELMTGAVKTVEICCPEPRQVKVRIPARTYERCFYHLEEVLCEGEEEPARKNIVVIVLLKEQKGFERRNYHLYSTQQVSYMVMALGGEIEIPTIEGSVKYCLEPGTRNGARIRLAGKGLWMPPKIGNRGDQYVTLQVEIPRSLNDRQKAALRAFWDTMEENA